MNKMSLRIYQIAEGYCYNSDSLFLWNFILPYLRPKQKILELGSGSGVIGLLCAREKNILLHQIEKQKEYAFLNAKNARSNNIQSYIYHADCCQLLTTNDVQSIFRNSLLYPRVSFCSSISFIQDSQKDTKDMQKTPYIFSQSNDCGGESFTTELLQNNQKVHFDSIGLQYFDMIISNPPFYSNQAPIVKNRFKEIARQSSNLPLEQFILIAKKMLKPHGKLIFCYSPSVLPEIFRLLQSYNFGIESLRFVYPKIYKNATLVLIYAKRDSKAYPHILSPLITHIGDTQMDNSLEVQTIYKEAMTHSIKIYQDDILWEKILE
ncbi:hypothetical protein CQA53_04735 [Helicobacter didelphidarum]|uniref:Uncharacterized protein n=1 Tax=Helicobacter didelphidarum TaxID=2040648 RepID=A0A3D8ILL4_9HELI|nr:methyltransferase [Helicobacter didelphidarum]RDU66109.1 hypothetical protein CQA53_04735 [Helicobacter didelphidarum]